tara:strand:+ start:239 stop:388 length:150 start_codon:yes stop_codon:yes gene_type:complete
MGRKSNSFYDLNDKVNKAIYNKGYRAGKKSIEKSTKGFWQRLMFVLRGK